MNFHAIFYETLSYANKNLNLMNDTPDKAPTNMFTKNLLNSNIFAGVSAFANYSSKRL